MNTTRLKVMSKANLDGDKKLHALMRGLIPPPYFAVVYCEYEDEYGLSYYKAGTGRRWGCKTCWNFATPVWSTNKNKCPSEDEALHEYVAWQSKLGKNSSFRAWQKGINGNDIR